MKRDLRNLALARPRATLAGFGVLSLIFGYGNLITTKGAILEDAILDPTDSYRQMDEYVRARSDVGYRGQGETVPFILYFPDGIRRRADLSRIAEFSRAVAAELPGAVISLATMPHYENDDGVMRLEPYIPARLPDDIAIDEWRRAVAADPSVFGLLVGREFEWAAVVLALPVDVDEVATFRRIAEFVEQRTIPWWEWFYKTDIDTPADLGLASNLVLRGLIDQNLNVDGVTLVLLGTVLTLPLFVWCFGDVRTALIAILVVVEAGVIWTRGAIGLAQLFDVDIKERLYVLLAYANCVVQGVSFSLHKYQSYYAANRVDSPESRWRAAQRVDPLIAFTALVSVFGFATLYWFQVRAIRELGVISAVGVLFIFFHACVVLPAADLVFGGGDRSFSKVRAPAFLGVSSLARRLVTLRPRRAIAGLCLLTAFVTLLIWPGKQLRVWTRSLSFVEGSAIARSAAFMDVPGRIGSGTFDMLVEPRDPETRIDDVGFLESATELMDTIRSDPRTREIQSVLATLRRVSSVTFGHARPETADEAAAALSLVSSGLPREVAASLFYTGGVRVSVHHAVARSDEIGEFHADLLRVAADRFPSLRVSAYGPRALFPQWDRYIRIGKPLNLMTSQVFVALLCMMRIVLVNRRRAHARWQVRPIPGGIAATTPFMFATCVVALVMMVLGVPLDAATAALTALSINASVDFAIYLLDEYQTVVAEIDSPQRAAIVAVTRKAPIIFADALLNTCCFLPLLTSSFQPIRELGWIMGLMLGACAAGTFLVFASVLPATVRKSDDETGRGATSWR